MDDDRKYTPLKYFWVLVVLSVLGFGYIGYVIEKVKEYMVEGDLETWRSSCSFVQKRLGRDASLCYFDFSENE